MNDNKLAGDESRREVQHQSVKAKVEGDVNAEITHQASQGPSEAEGQKIGRVAGQFRSKAVDEVVNTEREVQRSRSLARGSQFIDYGFFLIYGLLGLRFVLALVAARSDAGFVRFIVGITSPFYAPFEGIVGSPSGAGHTLALPLVVAILVYGLLHLAITGFLGLLANRKTAF